MKMQMKKSANLVGRKQPPDLVGRSSLHLPIMHKKEAIHAKYYFVWEKLDPRSLWIISQNSNPNSNFLYLSSCRRIQPTTQTIFLMLRRYVKYAWENNFKFITLINILMEYQKLQYKVQQLLLHAGTKQQTW